MLAMTSSPYTNGKKVTDANFDLIEPGMTLDEVTAILGPSDQDGMMEPFGPQFSSFKWKESPGWFLKLRILEITVHFKDGKVDDKRKFGYCL